MKREKPQPTTLALVRTKRRGEVKGVHARQAACWCKKGWHDLRFTRFCVVGEELEVGICTRTSPNDSEKS